MKASFVLFCSTYPIANGTSVQPQPTPSAALLSWGGFNAVFSPGHCHSSPNGFTFATVAYLALMVMRSIRFFSATGAGLIATLTSFFRNRSRSLTIAGSK